MAEPDGHFYVTSGRTCCRSWTRWKTSVCPRAWLAFPPPSRKTADASFSPGSAWAGALTTNPTNFPAANNSASLARALINEPELILADEPTGNLDSHTGGEIIELLIKLRAEKSTTLIVATHDASVAARAPKVVELVDGIIQNSAGVTVT